MTHLAYRKSIRALLDDIAALSEVEGPGELINMWFDDLYLPGFDPNDYSQKAWEQGRRDWSECFAASEQIVLDRFHHVFATNLPYLSQELPGWREDPHWLEVSRAARAAIESFDAAA